MARKRDQAAFEARKAEIRDAAEALFATHGFHQTGIAAICAAVGMSPGALYRYFASKTEIIRAIVEKERLDSVAWIEQLAAAEHLPTALVELTAATLIDLADPDYARLTTEIVAEGHRNPEIGALLEDLYEDLVARIAEVFRTAQAAGQIAADVDAEATARIIVALMDGATADGPALANLPAPRLRATLERLVRGLLG